MANRIQAEHDASTAMTLTAASLASSTAGVDRQSTMISNVDDGQLIQIYYKITTGTSPTANKTITIYLIKGDDPSSSNIRTDNAGASDAGLTVVTARQIDVITTDATSNHTYYGSCIIRNPGPEWGIAIVQDTGVALNATGSNHAFRYVVENQEVQ